MKKLQQNEIEKLHSIQEEYNKKVFEFGRLKEAQIELEDQFEELRQMETQLRNDYKELQENEQSFAKELEDKYGNVEINLDDGTISDQE